MNESVLMELRPTVRSPIGVPPIQSVDISPEIFSTLV